MTSLNDSPNLNPFTSVLMLGAIGTAHRAFVSVIGQTNQMASRLEVVEEFKYL